MNGEDLKRLKKGFREDSDRAQKGVKKGLGMGQKGPRYRPKDGSEKGDFE